ncbi:MAG: RNA polymerase sigma factor [Bacteroidales bacterium]|nr:RNA polymerase sigma factor [Bacteroidales bacterium]MBN2698170.1 RNA polymerase sigma factor [Bacteroidales bacterium]
MPDLDDMDIIQEFKTSERQESAFNKLVQKYQERLYWHIRKILINHEDTDDVLQNTFIKIWRSLHDFREEAKLYTWLYRIATNEALTFLKMRKRKPYLPTDDGWIQYGQNLESDVYFNGDEIQRKLQMAIQRLPEKQKVVFNLKYFEEMKYEEMAEILKTSVGALKASYHHAVKKIEAYMNDD